MRKYLSASTLVYDALVYIACPSEMNGNKAIDIVYKTLLACIHHIYVPMPEKVCASNDKRCLIKRKPVVKVLSFTDVGVSALVALHSLYGAYAGTYLQAVVVLHRKPQPAMPGRAPA